MMSAEGENRRKIDSGTMMNNAATNKKKKKKRGGTLQVQSGNNRMQMAK